jgi:hypothetical protein
VTKHERALGPEVDAERQAAINAAARAISAAVTACDRLPDGKGILGEMVCVVLDEVAGGAPEYSPFGDMRESANWWADCATPVELEIYTAAALRRIKRTTFAERARKRIFTALWHGFAEDDRQKFLTHVKKKEAPP